MPGCDTGDSYYQAGATFGGELCGFMDGVSDTHVAWTVNIEAVFPTDRFKAYCLEVNALKALDRLDNLNRVPMSLSNMASIQRQFRAGQDGKLTTSAGLYGFFVTLLEDPEDPPLEAAGCKNDRLLRMFVQLAHDHADDVPPLQLSDVYKMLPTSRSTLAAATREVWIGPEGTDEAGQVGAVPDGIFEAEWWHQGGDDDAALWLYEPQGLRRSLPQCVSRITKCSAATRVWAAKAEGGLNPWAVLS